MLRALQMAQQLSAGRAVRLVALVHLSGAAMLLTVLFDCIHKVRDLTKVCLCQP